MFPSKSSVLSGGSLLENNYSVLLDGTDDYVKCGNDSSLELTTSVTIMAWFNPIGFTTGGTVNIICGKQSNAVGGWKGYALAARDNEIGENRIHFYIAEDTGGGTFTKVDQDVDLVVGTWYHAVGTYDNATMKLYVNGVLIDSYGVSDGLEVAGDPTEFEIGRSNSSINYFNSYTDEVGVFNTVLSAGQIASIYNDGVPNDLRDFPGLVGYWRFEEGSGTTVADLSGTGNTGTIVNGVHSTYTPPA